MRRDTYQHRQLKSQLARSNRLENFHISHFSRHRIFAKFSFPFELSKKMKQCSGNRHTFEASVKAELPIKSHHNEYFNFYAVQSQMWARKKKALWVCARHWTRTIKGTECNEWLHTSCLQVQQDARWLIHKRVRSHKCIGKVAASSASNARRVAFIHLITWPKMYI